MTKFEQGLLKGAKIVLYHGGSWALLTLMTYIVSQASVPGWFVTAFTHVGLPLATINALWAGVVQAVQNKMPNGTTIDTAPPQA